MHAIVRPRLRTACHAAALQEQLEQKCMVAASLIRFQLTRGLAHGMRAG